MNDWSPTEVALLKKLYPSTSNKELEKHLPGRSKNAIAAQLAKLRLKRDNNALDYRFPKLLDAEKAYFAGLFDGEGCIHISVHPPHGEGKNVYHCLQVIISNTDVDIINYLHATFGGYVHLLSPRPRHRHCYEWVLRSRRARLFLECLLPFLRIKKEQAELAIEFQSTMRGHSRELSPEIIEVRDGYRLAIVKLKGKHLRRAG